MNYGNNCDDRPTAFKKNYRIAIMAANGETSFHGWFSSLSEVQNAVEEIRKLYAKHDIQQHVGYLEV